MQFKHPEILYALLLLLIPIIVHLFQLRRFQKVPFTNVAFLKKVTLQTRKSSIIKKWLTLATRLLLLAAIVFAFAQPYTSKKNSFKTQQETVIYLDNSFSMQAKGEKGPLLQRAIQDLIETIDPSETISILTNSNYFRNTTIDAIKNELIQLDYSANQLDYNAALLQAKKTFSKENTSLKNLIFISDFQQKKESFSFTKDSLITINLVQLQPVNINNINLDSLYISKKNSTNLELTVLLKNQGDPVKDVSISLYDNETLMAKSSVDIDEIAETIFTLPVNQEINGKLVINDAQLQFDNTLYFNINKPERINVFSINNADDSYLNKVFQANEFNYNSVLQDQLNYNDIENQNLIILNELNTIPGSLSTAIKSFKINGGNILIIPSDKPDLTSYNQLFNVLNTIRFSDFETKERKITKINFSHPLYKDVFNKKISNFQYPKVRSYYTFSAGNKSNILNLEDGKPFLIGNSQVYTFSSALNESNSNFINSPLIVPTLYNIAKQSLQLSKSFYIIGKEHNIDVKTYLKQDEILSLEKGDAKIIPQQQTFKNKVVLTTNEAPEISGIYRITNDNNVLQSISYNYSRTESTLNYINLKDVTNETIYNSASELINKIKSNTKINELWKWFVIFALGLLILEMLILKFFK